MKSFTISSSGKVRRSLGSTLAALKCTQLKLANFSVSFKTALKAVVSVISTLHISISTFLFAALTNCRMVSRS